MGKLLKKTKRAIKWIDTLETTDLLQGKEALGDAEEGYCCLGIGCKVLGIPYLPSAQHSFELVDKVGLRDLHGDFKEALVINGFEWESLAEVNDMTATNFEGIAKIIKNNPRNVFRKKVARQLEEYYTNKTKN